MTQAHTQSLLTRGKHADRHWEHVGTQICTSSSRPRRYRARPRASSVGVRRGDVGADGLGDSQPASFYCLTVMLPQMLLSSHKLFTSGYTKENSVALIVAEGKFIYPTAASTARPLLQTYANPTCLNSGLYICLYM